MGSPGCTENCHGCVDQEIIYTQYHIISVMDYNFLLMYVFLFINYLYGLVLFSEAAVPQIIFICEVVLLTSKTVYHLVTKFLG